MSTINENIADDGTVPIYDPDVIWDGPKEDSVYHVTEDIVLSQTEYSFKENVTLVFLNDAKIICADPKTGVTLIGNHTKIVAPLIQIFGDGVKAEGIWDIDRAYPQWFGCTTFDTCPVYAIKGKDQCNFNADYPDAGEAINKAIVMKHIGEVFLPRGFYVVKTQIRLKVGIQLVGEIGMENDENGINSEGKDLYLMGTTLVPWGYDANVVGEQVCKADDKFLIVVNILGTEGLRYKDFCSGQVTAIRKLSFYNPLLYIREIVQLDNSPAQIGAIKSYRGLSVENVRFGGFRRAVVYDHNNYLDNKKIVDCDYYGNEDAYIAAYTPDGDATNDATGDVDSNEENDGNEGNDTDATSALYDKRWAERDNDVYAFDLGGLGDAMLFEHNGIHNSLCNKALRVGSCFGGLITANIINSDCVFLGSKNIIFSCNHLESGAQVVIDTAQVTLQENHIEVKSSPAICINGSYYDDLSVVYLSNNSFRFIDGTRGGVTDEELVDKRFQNFSEADIVIDNNSVLMIDNCFRYWTRENLAGKSYPYGIRIKQEYVDVTTINKQDVYSFNTRFFDDFNRYSYKLSSHCKIKENFTIEKNFVVTNPNVPIQFAIMANDGVNWRGDDASYNYSFQIIWGKSGDTELAANISGMEKDDNGRYIIGTVKVSRGNGTLIVNNKDYGCHEVLIRLFREKVDDPSTLCYVDVPLSGTRYLHDNGISVCGYKWSTELPNNNIAALESGVRQLGVSGDVVYVVTSGIELLDV